MAIEGEYRQVMRLNAEQARSDDVRYDDARIGFASSEDSSPPAIRERASLMVSVVFFAAM